jgi:hypothetical protein
VTRFKTRSYLINMWADVQRATEMYPSVSIDERLATPATRDLCEATSHAGRSSRMRTRDCSA